MASGTSLESSLRGTLAFLIMTAIALLMVWVGPNDPLPAISEAVQKVALESNLNQWLDVKLCPLGVMTAALHLYDACKSQNVEVCYDNELLDNIIQTVHRNMDITTILGTKWPIYKILSRPSFFDESVANDEFLNCQHADFDVMPWDQLQASFWADNWFDESQRFVYSRDFQASWIQTMNECPLGFAMVSLWKMSLCAQTQAGCYDGYHSVVQKHIQQFHWKEIAGGRWRVFGIMAELSDNMRRHSYDLDFLPAELRGEVTSEMIASNEVSESYRGVLNSLEHGAAETFVTETPENEIVSRPFVYGTMVFGESFNRHIERFVQRAVSVGINNLVIMCLDDDAIRICGENLHKSRCVPGRPSILNKFTFPLVYMHFGVDMFWLDFDIFLFQNPNPYFQKQLRQEKVDLLVSGSFADSCICSGLVYFGSTKVTRKWLLDLLSWMYERTYTHDQQTFSAFLAPKPDKGQTTTPEEVCKEQKFLNYFNFMPPDWAVLDPVSQYIHARVLNTTGWSGNIQDIVIFHLLHGDSELNTEHRGRQWNTKSGGFADPNAPLMDIFYSGPDKYYTSNISPYESPELENATMRSWREERPSEMLHCGPLKLNPSRPGYESPDG
eukprot:gene685-575_t